MGKEMHSTFDVKDDYIKKINVWALFYLQKENNIEFLPA
jgi:hypothetical protein